jgi:hypothetical protein
VSLRKTRPRILRASFALGFPGKTSAKITPDHRKLSQASFIPTREDTAQTRVCVARGVIVRESSRESTLAGSILPTPKLLSPFVLLLGRFHVVALLPSFWFCHRIADVTLRNDGVSLGRVFTANMTGNIVLLAFARAHVSGLPIARSLTALVAFLVGAILGGRVMARASADSEIRFAAQAFLPEVAFLFAASFCGIRIAKRFAGTFFSTICSDRLDGSRDGHTQCRCPEARNPGFDDNGPDTNDHGHRRNSSLANGNNPGLARRVASVAAMFLGE